MSRLRVAILGGGLAGLAAAYKLSAASIHTTIYEKNCYLGGHASSRLVSGFTFDEGPHISFTKNEKIQKFFSSVVGGEYFEAEASILNYWKGCWLKHPVQTNLYGLPPEVIEKCIDGFKNKEHIVSSPQSYQDWCLGQFGQDICDQFIFPYTRKYWTLPASELSCDWVSKRVYTPTLAEVLHGAAGVNTTNNHYITSFRYPKRGGFNAYLNFAPKECEYLLETTVTNLTLPGDKLKKWSVSSSDNKIREFDYVISSLPLPITIGLIKDAPQSVVEAASKLKCTSTVLINIGLKAGANLPKAHWLYVYDEELLFSRIHFPHMLSPNNCPPGCSSLQAEIYYSESLPLLNVDLVEHTVKQLVQTGIILSEDQIVLKESVTVPYANVVFDHSRSSALECINSFLDQSTMLRCGRYGNWGYYWTDDTIVSAWDVAEKILQFAVKNGRHREK